MLHNLLRFAMICLHGLFGAASVRAIRSVTWHSSGPIKRNGEPTASNVVGSSIGEELPSERIAHNHDVQIR